MSDRAFLETNVLVYLVGDDLEKKRQALELCKEGGDLSTNVLNEYSNVCRRKLKRMPSEIRNDVEFLLSKLKLVVPGLDVFYMCSRPQREIWILPL